MVVTFQVYMSLVSWSGNKDFKKTHFLKKLSESKELLITLLGILRTLWLYIKMSIIFRVLH